MKETDCLIEEATAHLKSEMIMSPRSWIMLSLIIIGGLVYNSFLHGSDFHIFLVTGRRVYQGLEIYLRSDGPEPFKYHPAWAVVFTPLTFLPESFAKITFVIFQLALWFYSASCVGGVLNLKFDRPKALFILLLLVLNPLSAETGYGQVNALLFLGTVIVIECLENPNQKPRIAGAIIAGLVALKLNFALLLGYGLFKNRKVFPGFIYGIFALHLVTAISRGDFYGGHAYGEWIYLLMEQSRDQQWSYESQGLLRFCHDLLGPYDFIGWVSAVAVLLWLGFALDKQQPKVEKGAILCFWLTSLFLTSPLAWWYLVLWVYPLGFYLAFRSPSPLERKIAWACIGFFALGSYSVLGSERLIGFKLALGFFWPTVVLLAMFVRRQWKEPRTS